MLSLVECHKEILSQVGKCVCRGIILLNTFAKAMCSDWSAEYHKKFTSLAEKYLQRHHPTGVLKYFCREIYEAYSDRSLKYLERKCGADQQSHLKNLRHQ